MNDSPTPNPFDAADPQHDSWAAGFADGAASKVMDPTVLRDRARRRAYQSGWNAGWKPPEKAKRTTKPPVQSPASPAQQAWNGVGKNFRPKGSAIIGGKVIMPGDPQHPRYREHLNEMKRLAAAVAKNNRTEPRVAAPSAQAGQAPREGGGSAANPVNSPDATAEPCAPAPQVSPAAVEPPPAAAADDEAPAASGEAAGAVRHVADATAEQVIDLRKFAIEAATALVPNDAHDLIAEAVKIERYLFRGGTS